MAAPPLSGRVQAAFWMVVSGIAFAGLWIMVRLAADELHPFVVAFWSYALGLLWLAPMVLTPSVGSAVRVSFEQLPEHIRRLPLALVATFATYDAVANVPLASVLAIRYLAPWLAMGGGVLLLRERIGRVRSAALGVGLVGALMVLYPGALPMTDGALAAIVAAFAVAGAALLRRRFPVDCDPRAAVFWHFLLAAPLSLPLVFPLWDWPSHNLWPILFSMGACTAAGHMGLANAVRILKRGTVKPFEFVRFPLVALAGIALFREQYSLPILLGAALLLLVALVIERRRPDAARDPG